MALSSRPGNGRAGARPLRWPPWGRTRGPVRPLIGPVHATEPGSAVEATEWREGHAAAARPFQKRAVVPGLTTLGDKPHGPVRPTSRRSPVRARDRPRSVVLQA